MQRLLGEVKLVEESFSFLEMPDLTVDEFVARQLKLSVLKHAAVQSERPEVGLQTDAVEVNSAVVQAPEDLMRDRAKARAALTSYDSKRLLKFLAVAAPVCEALLLENVGGYADAASSGGGSDQTQLLPFTSHQLLLPLPAIFGRRSVVDIQFSARRNGLLLVAYSKPILDAAADAKAAAAASPTSPSAAASTPSSKSAKALGAAAESDSKGLSRGQVPINFLNHKGLLCLWDLNNPKQPSR